MKKDDRHKVIGGRHRARSRYAMMINRCMGIGSKNECYSGVNVLVSKEDFMDWFIKNDYIGCSVDRIDKTGGYTLENMQLIPLAENIRKDKTNHIDGLCQCYSCNKIKPSDYFSRDKRRMNGRSTLCSECDNLRKVNKGAYGGK